MRKVILDTSVLIYNPGCLKDFANSEVVLPIAVIDELDKLKKLPNEAGKNARVSIRMLDQLSNMGDISVGILTEDNVLVRIDTTDYPNNFGDALYGDTRILACAQAVTKKFPTESVVLVSRDFNLRIRYRALGLEAESYEKNAVEASDLYGGIRTVCDLEAAEDLINTGHIDPRCFGLDLYPNECVAFTDECGDDLVFAKKTSSDRLKIVKASYPWSLSPRNKEQVFAANLIMDMNIPLVTLVGKAGCGKSIVTLAAALEMVLHQKKYEKFIVYRPIQPMGNDIGYTPGSIAEKLEPWFQAIMDNFEVLFSASSKDSKWRTSFEAVKKKDKIQFEALTYIRGRSIPNAIILLDEAQNISPEEMKTILTRVGENTKIILTGDISQIDNRALDPINNGLTYAAEKFKDSELAGHVTFTKGERSRLATKASEIL
mgnify:CR=1 FL=1